MLLSAEDFRQLCGTDDLSFGHETQAPAPNLCIRVRKEGDTSDGSRLSKGWFLAGQLT